VVGVGVEVVVDVEVRVVVNLEGGLAWTRQGPGGGKGETAVPQMNQDEDEEEEEDDSSDDGLLENACLLEGDVR